MIYQITFGETMAKESPRNPDRDAFLNFIRERGIGRSQAEVEYWYQQICTAALEWLLNHEKPVDMYFVRLHNCPLRIDWKERLFHRIEQSKKDYKKSICAPSLYAIEKDELFCFRHIESELTEFGRKEIIRVERARLKMLTPLKYAKYFYESARRLSAPLVKIFEAWCKDRKHLRADIRASNKNRDYRFVAMPLGGWRVINITKILDRDRRINGETESSEQEAVPATDGVVPEVCAVQSPEENLRDSGGALHEPGE